MMFALIQLNPLAVIQQFGSLPTRLFIAGGLDVQAPTLGWTDGTYMLVSVAPAGAPPTQWAKVTGQTLSLAGNTLTVTTTYTAGIPTQAQLTAYAAQKRQAKMLGGTTVNTVPVPTDAGTLGLLSLAYTKSVQTPTFTMPWYNTATQAWTTLNATQIQNAAQTVGQFLAGCLNSEQQADAGINAGTITTQAQVDALF